MARKLSKDQATHASAPAPQADAGADDLSVLVPDVTLDVAGRKVTVREYRFIDGMRARVKAKQLIDDLEQFVRDGGAADAGVEDYVDLLAKYEALVRELLADSVDGADADWIDSLSDADGQQLLLTWWGVCGRFFVRVVAARLRDRLLAEARRASAGLTSSPNSQPADTEAPPISAPATPSVN